MIRVLAPSKINLFLRVLGKREDGYHEIISLVDIVSLCDVIHVKEIEHDAVFVTDEQGILEEGEGNSVYRMLMLVKQRFGIRKGMSVHIEKHIPIGGGLGGSSTDAAEVLKIVNRLWHLGLSLEEMVELGKEVGSDVPLFLYGLPCLIRGKGERVEPFHIPPLTYLIVYPGVPSIAREVYEKITPQGGSIEVGFEVLRDRDQVYSMLHNDLEAPAMLLHPVIGEMKAELKRCGAAGVLMCGSGSSVFGIFENDTDLGRARLEMEKMGWYTFVVKSLRRQRKLWRSQR